MKKRIVGVQPGSIAEELGIEAGQYLISIDDHPIQDRLDYLFFTGKLNFELLIEDEEGLVEYSIEKEPEEELGLIFADGLMDEAKHCQNRCVFCFIDQLPKNMRKSLYFKDDDSRLSFMQGNFVTLTNMKQKDLERIIHHRIYPINISVHTLDPQLRVRMTGNPKSGDIETKIRFLAQHGALMNAQIVLVPDYNDGAQLEKTLRGLFAYYPGMNSVAVVPLGMTRFREHCVPLKPVNERVAGETLDILKRLQDEFLEASGTRFCFAADEFYLRAGRELPAEDEYEGYLHYENGVGMIRSFLEEFEAHIGRQRKMGKKPYHLICGTDFKPWLENIVEELNIKYNMSVKLQGIHNDFFGRTISVSGLLTFEDVVKQCRAAEAATVILPGNMFNFDGLTLDDQRREDFESTLKRPVRVVEPNAQALIRALKE